MVAVVAFVADGVADAFADVGAFDADVVATVGRLLAGAAVAEAGLVAVAFDVVGVGRPDVVVGAATGDDVCDAVGVVWSDAPVAGLTAGGLIVDGAAAKLETGCAA